MFASLSPENRRRSAYIDNILEGMHSTLALPEIQASLAKSPLDNTAAQIESRLDRLLFVNVRQGAIKAPRQMQTDSIPIVALNPGESITVDASLGGLTPQQAEGVRRSFTSWFDTEVALEEVDRIDEKLRRTHELESREVYGWVHRDVHDIRLRETTPNTENDPYWSFLGRPLVIMTMSPGTSLDERIITTAHEFDHVRRAEEQPVFRPALLLEDKYVREFRAFHVGALYAMGLQQSDRPFDGGIAALDHFKIEAVRSAHARPEAPFLATDAHKKAIHDRQLGHFFDQV